MDKYKTITAVVFFIAGIILPIIFIIIGFTNGVWQYYQHNQGTAPDPNLTVLVTRVFIFAMVAFFVPFFLGVGLLFAVKDLSWISTSLPFLFSSLYTISLVDAIPDLAPVVGRIDDGTAVTFGAVFSFILALRRNPNTPKWVFIPLILAAIYTFFGGFIPGGLDETIVQALAFLTFLYGARQNLPVPKVDPSNVVIDADNSI